MIDWCAQANQYTEEYEQLEEICERVAISDTRRKQIDTVKAKVKWDDGPGTLDLAEKVKVMPPNKTLVLTLALAL